MGQFGWTKTVLSIGFCFASFCSLWTFPATHSNKFDYCAGDGIYNKNSTVAESAEWLFISTRFDSCEILYLSGLHTTRPSSLKWEREWYKTWDKWADVKMHFWEKFHEEIFVRRRVLVKSTIRPNQDGDFSSQMYDLSHCIKSRWFRSFWTVRRFSKRSPARAIFAVKVRAYFVLAPSVWGHGILA